MSFCWSLIVIHHCKIACRPSAAVVLTTGLKRAVRNDLLKRLLFSPSGRDLSLPEKSMHDICLCIYWKWQMMSDLYASLLKLDDIQRLGIRIPLSTRVWLFCMVLMNTHGNWVNMSEQRSSHVDFERIPRGMCILVSGPSLSCFIDPVVFWWRLGFNVSDAQNDWITSWWDFLNFYRAYCFLLLVSHWFLTYIPLSCNYILFVL